MKRIYAAVFFLIFFENVSYAQSGNHGVLYSNTDPKYKNSSHSSYVTGPNSLSSVGNSIDHEAWRSGFAGTLVMWRTLVTNALPSNEPISKTSKK